MLKNLKKVTIYAQDEMMGVVRAVEGHLISEGTQKWAQYGAVPFVEFLPKRARKTRIIRASGFKPFLIIVEGWGKLQPAGLYDGMKSEAGSGCTVTRGRYRSCDSRWISDFMHQLEEDSGLIYVSKYTPDFDTRDVFKIEPKIEEPAEKVSTLKVEIQPDVSEIWSPLDPEEIRKRFKDASKTRLVKEKRFCWMTDSWVTD